MNYHPTKSKNSNSNFRDNTSNFSIELNAKKCVALNFPESNLNYEIMNNILLLLESDAIEEIHPNVAILLLFKIGKSYTNKYESYTIKTKVMDKLIRSMYVLFDNKAIAFCCHGLRNLKDLEESTLTLILVLTEKISESHALLTGSQISLACSGLCNLSGDTEEIQGLLEQLAYKIDQSDAVMSSNEISNACYGIQNLSGAGIYGEKLIAALTEKIKSANNALKSELKFNSNDISKCCYALKSLKDNNIGK